MNNAERFDSVLYAVTEPIKSLLSGLPETVKANTQEIRLRIGLPIALTVSSETVFLRSDGNLCFYNSLDLPKASQKDIENCFSLLCGNSIYAHTDELKQGFVSMKNGSRAGVCGTLCENGFMKDISGINIRIAKEIYGAANDIIKNYSSGGLLIAGGAGTGKTTILRDLVRQISSGCLGKLKRVCVIDSRCEISGSAKGGSINNLGPATDVLITPDKAKGIEIAIRTMFPEVIAFDEIGNLAELGRVSEGFLSGVEFITTAHIGSKEELMKRKITRNLLESGAIKHIALLPCLLGGEITFLETKELLCQPCF